MNKFAKFAPEELDEHLSHYIVERLSYSMLRTFCRNEKAFERSYIFGIRSPIGASGLAGATYHDSLKEFFRNMKNGKQLSLNQFLEIGYKHIDKKHPIELATSKTCPTIDHVKKKADKIFSAGANNFFKEIDSYLDDIKRIIAIEEKFVTFIVICGEDIPLPFAYVPDFIYINHQDQLCCTDHKMKSAYTDDEEVHLSCSLQSKIYEKGINAEIALGNPIFADCPKKLEKFYYFENKHSENKDKTRQIRRISISLDECGEIYEELVYEAATRVLRAAQDPDWTYLVNPDDKFDPAGDMMDFWLKTKIQKIEDFKKLSPKRRRFLAKRKKRSRYIGMAKIPKAVIKKFQNAKKFVSLNPTNMEENMTNSQKIAHRLRFFGIHVEVAEVIEGYACDTYLLRVGAGTKIMSIIMCELDIANALGAESVLIPRRLVRKDEESFVAVDVNRREEERRFAELPAGNAFPKIPLGVSNFGEQIHWDLTDPSTPHLMLSGASGSGKSVVIRSIIESAKRGGADVKILDPKFEFTKLGSITEQEEIERFIAQRVELMNDIFRGKAKKKNEIIIFDEAADSFARETKFKKSSGMKTLSENILLLSQKARSAGIHLVLAAQRFSTKILTGDVKANFTSRLALTCAKEVDSYVMLDAPGAEKLAGKGDALFVSPRYPEPIRIQSFSLKI